MKENNIEASSICAIFTNERDFVSDDPVIRKQAVEYMKKCVDFSVAIGAKSISTQVTANMKIDADAPFETAWTWAVEGLKEAGEYLHIADSNRAAPGRGHIDFEEIAQALKDIDYNGWISMELLPAAANPFSGIVQEEFYDQYTEESITYLKKLFS